MKNTEIQIILTDIAEQAVPSAEIDLWQAMRPHLATSESRLLPGDVPMKTDFPRRPTLRRVALAALALIVVFAILFSTPQGQALAQSLLQFFVRVPGDAMPAPSQEPVKWVAVTPGAPLATMTPLPAIAAFAAECGDINNPTCSIEQIRSKVDFTVKELGAAQAMQLPFMGATGGPDAIWLHYQHLIISEERWTGQPIQEKSEIGASAVVEKVQIGNLAGEYYQGSFTMNDGDNTLKWDAKLGTETLRWLDGGTLYTMDGWADTPFGKTTMVALAESMTTEPVVKTPAPTMQPDLNGWNPRDTYPLSLAQAEQQAGFKLLLPSQLPEMLSPAGALYDADHKVVAAFYLLDQNRYGPNTDGFTLFQQIAPNPTGCDLCGIALGDYNTLNVDPTYIRLVPPDADLETVLVGAVKGQYTQGVWSGTDCCGWVWDPTVYSKTLRWWAGGMAFELHYFGESIEKADMLRIAESLK